ncbi:MAG: hypothetical protein IRY95_03745, partial [Clostridia bacterium]|nr:hypothetical protein [Clostridia bacterium]
MPLDGSRVLITAGPTRAYLDSVRYLTNFSTGELGRHLAEGALRRGASVTYVYGPGCQLPAVAPLAGRELDLWPVETVADLETAVRRLLARQPADVIFHAMAVLDFQPAEVRPGKTSSELEEWVVRLVPTPKVAPLLRQLAPAAVLVTFKLETGRSRRELAAIAASAAGGCGAG